MGDFNCRMEEEQIKLMHLFYFWEDWMVDKENFSEKRYSKDESCNVEGKKLIEFCELNNFEMLWEIWIGYNRGIHF
jgi:murein L,D-transpeptidase YafK